MGLVRASIPVAFFIEEIQLRMLKASKMSRSPTHETCIYTENVSVQLVQLVHGHLALTTPGFG